MSEQRINTALLEKVKAHILEEPRRYDQSVYRRTSFEAPCGTAACIAGWTCILSDVTSTCSVGDPDCDCGIPSVARDLLGLTQAEASVLFEGFARQWPERFREHFQQAEDVRDKARAAADYLDFIIQTGKVTE